MLWLTWRGANAQARQYEIQATLQHDVTEGFRLHPECYVVGILDFAAALTDKGLTPVAAWRIGRNYATFEEAHPSQVKCEASITEGLYSNTSPGSRFVGTYAPPEPTAHIAGYGLPSRRVHNSSSE